MIIHSGKSYLETSVTSQQKNHLAYSGKLYSCFITCSYCSPFAVWHKNAGTDAIAWLRCRLYTRWSSYVPISTASITRNFV